jgi:hypothetical protein
VTSQNWVSLITPASSHGSGAGAVLNTATTATLSPIIGAVAAGDVAQVNAEGFYQGWESGLQIRVRARGYITTTGTSTTATFLLATRLGNTGSTYITLATTAGFATGTGTLTGLPWQLDGEIRCTAVGTSGNTVSTQAMLWIQNSASPALATANCVALGLPNASGETAAAVDTTSVQGLSLRGTLAGANATIALTQWYVEALS